jgi:hypothetical protein
MCLPMINIKAASGTDLSHPTPKPNIKKGPKLALQIENKLAFLGVGVKRLLMALVVMGLVIEGLQGSADGVMLGARQVAVGAENVKRSLGQAWWLGAAMLAKVICAPWRQFRKPRTTRLQLHVGAPLGSLGGHVRID